MSDYPRSPLLPLGQHLPTQLQTWITWVTSLKPVNVLMAKVAITKTGTLATILHKPVGEANKYVRFGYGLLKNCNNTQWQVSGSMNADPINIVHINQQSTK